MNCISISRFVWFLNSLILSNRSFRPSFCPSSGRFAVKNGPRMKFELLLIVYSNLNIFQLYIYPVFNCFNTPFPSINISISFIPIENKIGVRPQSASTFLLPVAFDNIPHLVSS